MRVIYIARGRHELCFTVELRYVLLGRPLPPTPTARPPSPRPGRPRVACAPPSSSYTGAHRITPFLSLSRRSFPLTSPAQCLVRRHVIKTKGILDISDRQKRLLFPAASVVSLPDDTPIGRRAPDELHLHPTQLSQLRGMIFNCC